MVSESHRRTIVWPNVLVLILYHLVALQGLYYLLSSTAKWQTTLWTVCATLLGSQGITAGAHRLWAHRAYKAKLPLRVCLCLLQTSLFQNSVYEWCRDHRVHHKFADTDADPHDARRGFFFSHVGWLLVRKHPAVISRGREVDMSDLEADPVVRFQKRYYALLAPIAAFALPPLVPFYFWHENFYVAFAASGMLRLVYSLHVTWLVNSAAHKWGFKPYDRNIKPSENRLVSYLTTGEGWHNYHHVFPWDYRAAEFSKFGGSFTTQFIDLMAKIGLAYDLRSAPTEVVQKTKEKANRANTKSF